MWPIVANRCAESRTAARTSADAAGGEVKKGYFLMTAYLTLACEVPLWLPTFLHHSRHDTISLRA